MEQQLLTNCQRILKQPDNQLSFQPFSLSRSLIINPSTSDQTITSLLETLSLSLSLHPDRILSLLSVLAALRPHLSHLIFNTVHSFSLLPNNPLRIAAHALSLLISISECDPTLIPSVSEISEGLFVSLCFRPCVSVRHWLLVNVERFHVRPSFLLTVLPGFTKDPYPYVRRAALDGLVNLGKCIVVEDHRSMIEGCYCCAVELLFDMEEYVRCSAVRAVSEWGQLLVVNSEDTSKRDWSDALYVQLCSMVRDMSMKVRIEVFDALGKTGIVSEDILMQTLSKKVLPITKVKRFPGQFSAKQYEVPVSSVAGAFVHGLEDEFHEVRRTACYSLCTPIIISADFAAQALNLLMDVLNDDSIVVRLEALKTMHHMAVFGNLRVQEIHMHMFLGTLHDSNTLIRFAARKVLRLTKLSDLAMFKLSVDSLIQSLDMYPQDEPDVFSVIFNIGQSHGTFAVSIIEEVFQEIEPSSDGKWDFDSAKTAARLVLAISAPLSRQKQQQVYNIPPIIFSYAVTMLGRISRGLIDVMDQNTLLDYLSRCSRSMGVSPPELFTGDDKVLPIVDVILPSGICSQITCPVEIESSGESQGASEIVSHGILKLSKTAASRVDNQLEVHDEANIVKLILAKIGEIWPLINFGCISEVLRTLRSWKEELATFFTGALQSADVLTFGLEYLRVVKLLVKVWLHLMGPRNFCSREVGELAIILEKLDRSLRLIRYRFIGLSKEEELHVLELILMTCTLRLYNFDAYSHESIMKKLYSIMSRVEFLNNDRSIDPSNFVIELKKLLHKIDTSIDGDANDVILFQKLLEFFSLDEFVFCGNFKHVKAEVDVRDNDWVNPLPFVSGLPVGIPLQITLHNTPTDTRLWLRMTLAKDLTQYVFLDLKQFEGSDKIREFTFTAPFYRTPKAHSVTMRVSIGMECLYEDVHSFRHCSGPKRELVYLCKEKEVYLSMVGKS